MKLSTFFKLVEIQTKIASQFPLIFGTLYALYRYRELDLSALLLFSVSLLFFDMTTTAINNYMDYKKARDEDYRENHNIIGIEKIKEWKVVAIILVMLTMAIAAGILLVLHTGPVVLLLGVISFFIGIFYTFGPIPISRMPLGEALSGFFMGFVILYLSVYIHNPQLGSIMVDQGRFRISLELMETLYIALVSAPFVLAISNLMLANNICDLEQDIKNDRFLLPYYIGKKNALALFRWSYHFMYLFIIAAVVLRVLPWACLLTLPVFILHRRLGRAFSLTQVKTQTFILAVKGLNWISASYILSLGLGMMLRHFVFKIWGFII